MKLSLETQGSNTLLVGGSIDWWLLCGDNCFNIANTITSAFYGTGPSSHTYVYIPDSFSFGYDYIAYSFVGGSCGNGISSGYTTFDIYWGAVDAWWVEVSLIHTR